MFFNLRAARNGEFLAISGKIETLGKRAYDISLEKTESRKAHINILLGEPQASPLNVLFKETEELTQLFSVPEDVDGVIVHVISSKGIFSYALPLAK